MASDKDFLDFVLEHIEGAGEITFKKMFGEYGLYCDGKLFGQIADNRLFIKPTVAGRAYIVDVVEDSPYPGAKLNFLIEEKVEDTEWLSALIRLTVKELPEPKPKKKKS